MADRKKSGTRVNLDQYDEDMKKEILRQLKKRERRRKFLCFLCIVAAVGCIGYFGAYYYLADKSAGQFEELAELKSKKPVSEGIKVHKTGAVEVPDILDEYKNLYNN